jgi:hypothetical protein
MSPKLIPAFFSQSRTTASNIFTEIVLSISRQDRTNSRSPKCLFNSRRRSSNSILQDHGPSVFSAQIKLSLTPKPTTSHEKDKNSLTLVASCVILSFCISCAGTSHMTFSVSDGQIPPDFKGYNDTLLAIKHPMDMNYDKYLRNNLKENYMDPHKMIDAADLTKYPPDQYRFVFDSKSNYTTRMDMGSTHTFTSPSSDKFFVIDRVSKKIFATQNSQFYSKLMRLSARPGK